jgi:hypothetical protein
MKQLMEAELIFDHPNGRDLAVAELTKQGVDVEFLDWVDADGEGNIDTPSVWIRVRIATELDAHCFLDWVQSIIEPFPGDVVFVERAA